MFKSDYKSINCWRVADTKIKMDDLDRQIEQLRRCEYIKESEVRDLCNFAKEILIEEPNI